MEWAPVSQRIWDMKYRFRDPSGQADAHLDATWWRLARALASPEVRDGLLRDGSEPVGSSAAAFTAVVGKDLRTWRKVVKEAGIKPE